MTTQEHQPDRWITLGTCGGPFQRPEAFQISNALVIGEDIYLFDVGNGVLRQLATLGLDPQRVRAVFISHHHPDHIADLGLVLLTRWLVPGPGTLVVGGPIGTAHLVDGLCGAYRFTALAAGDVGKGSMTSRVSVIDIQRTSPTAVSDVYEDEKIRVQAVTVEHYRGQRADNGPMNGDEPHAVGFRIAVGDRVIAYTGDTGPTPALSSLAHGADLLVTEVVSLEAIVADIRDRFGAHASELDRVQFNMENNHLTPDAIARFAADAKVKQLVLTHFVPLLAEDDQERLLAFLSSAVPGARVSAARDLDEFALLECVPVAQLSH